ncbi:MAG: hypothetical protein L6R38_006573 [Xanthoria sp. 2 TBL-2021]|nr:MAG: hypothetical protein L6R38_006573 [Xanthoria sp. 2 TBL-2021]
MTLTGPENTLLGLIKVYLTKADTNFSEEGLKSLVKLTQFKALLLHIAQVTPESVERLIIDLLDIVQADKERRENEKKKRALEAKEAGNQDIRAAKRQELATPVADTPTNVESSRGASKTPTEEASDPAEQATDSIKEKNETVHESARSGASTSSYASSASPHHLQETFADTLSSSSVSSRPTTISSIRSTVSPSPSAIGSTSHLPTSNESVLRSSDPTYSDHASASEVPVRRAASTVLHGPLNQTERLTQQSPLQDLNNSNTGNNELLLLANENPEVAIFTQDKDMVQQLRNHFEEEVYPSFSRYTKATKSDKHISDVLELCPMLNFDNVKDHLLAFIVQRRQTPGTRAQVIDLAEDAEPVAIFQAIKVSGVNEADAKLQRIYGQIQLVKSIDRKVEQGYIPRMYTSVDNVPLTELPTFYLDDMAYEMSKGLSQDLKKKLERQLRSERQAGINWMKIVDSLGGMGIVFVFVFAGKSMPPCLQRELHLTLNVGISRTKLAGEFNTFQRTCLIHIISKLPSIQALVKDLGDNALEDFCRHGRLSDEIEKKIRAAQGPEMPFVESDMEDSDDSDDEDNDEGSEKKLGLEQWYVAGRQIRKKDTTATEGPSGSADSPDIIDDDTDDCEANFSDEDDVDGA